VAKCSIDNGHSTGGKQRCASKDFGSLINLSTCFGKVQGRRVGTKSGLARSSLERIRKKFSGGAPD